MQLLYSARQIVGLVLIQIILLNLISVASSATIQESVIVCSIDNARWQAADNGYTLNGSWMNTSTRPKLLNAANFGASGTVSTTITIVDKFIIDPRNKTTC